MNVQALFTDGATRFVFPSEPIVNSKLTIRFRTAKDDVDSVTLVTGNDEYIALEKEKTEGEFDYYAASVFIGTEPLRFCFEIRSGEEVLFYCKNGPSISRPEHYQFMITPGFATPDWAKGAVMYQIYVDRFYNGDKTNDVEDREYYYIDDYSSKVTDWSKYPATMGVREFYGGDIQGVIDKLDYLQDLGVEVIYFNPLFVSPSNHKYDTQDYDYIDPHIGKIVEDGGEVLGEWETENRFATKYQKRVADFKNLEASNELFVHLVEELHKRGMKIILDGVFNHCGSFNKWMDRERIYEGQPGYAPGAFISADSPYHSYFQFINNHSGNWPYNGDYEGWWGHNTLPKLNYEDSQQLQDYIMEIGRKWVSPPYNIDGWRLDVAADLGKTLDFNHNFWRRFRQEVKKANPNAIIIAEHYGDASGWLQGDQWDTIMNYDAFMEPVTYFLTGMEKHSDQFKPEYLANAEHFSYLMRHNMSGMMMPTAMTAMNQLSNHDHSRFLTRTNHMVGRVANLGPEAANENVDVAVMRQAIIMQMTWSGAPTLYYGDEAGVCGFTDPDNRRTYPWGHEDHQMIEFHRIMIRIHKACPALMRGSVKLVEASENFLCYGRFTAGDRVMVFFNNSYETMEKIVRVHDVGVTSRDCLVQILETNADGFSEERRVYENRGGYLRLTIGPTSALILRVLKEDGDRFQ